MQTVNVRAIWLDYLRSFVTLLVVAHHAALAYPTFAYFNPVHYISSTAPIVDERRWAVMDTMIGFNDAFFMPLMFFISGLFVYRGLQKKGVKLYLQERLVRLGIPFLVAELILIPIAYFPSYYLSTRSVSVVDFIQDYVVTQQWPVGPPWFIWLLLAFDGLATLLFSYKPTFSISVGSWLAGMSQSPGRLFAAVYVMVALSFIPLSLWVGQYTWIGNWGPFDFQLNRVLFYVLFFTLGVSLGTIDWQSYLFKQGKFLGRDWLFWICLSIGCYMLVRVVADSGEKLVKQGIFTSVIGYLLFDLMFVASCLASMGACLSFFRQKMNRRLRRWGNLSENAYGIYVVHYSFVTWLQFALLNIDLPIPVKFALVFIGTIGASWLTSNLLRFNGSVRSVL